MALKLSATVKNAALDALESAIGTAPVLKIRTGAVPAAITDADSGTVLATLTLPTDWMAAASGGQKALNGTWEDINADADGTAGHFRIYAADGTTQHIQGSVSASGGGGDMIVDSVAFTTGQTFTVSVFTIAHGN